MNYGESKKILEEIKKAKKILLNCHTNPDADSIGSALSLYRVLKKMGKVVKIVCPDNLPDNLDFLPSVEVIKKVNFSKFDFSSFDLFIALDSSSQERITGDQEVSLPITPIIVIDHHNGNSIESELKLLDSEISSTAELLYSVYEDWGVRIEKDIATTLLTGIIGDTGAFKFPNTTATTFKIAAKLIEAGADKNLIVFNSYQRNKIEVLRFWGDLLKKLQIDKEGKFVWLVLDEQEFAKYRVPKDAKSEAASMFLQGVEGTNFGMIIIEKKQGTTTSVSLRSRLGVDVSALAAELGGGGHREAAGAEMKGVPLNEAVEKILEVARKYARENSQRN